MLVKPQALMGDTISVHPTFVLSVTGHRVLSPMEIDWAGAQARALFDHVSEAQASSGTAVRLLGALAAGADQLLAEAGAAYPAIVLDALLPYAVATYREGLGDGLDPERAGAASRQFDRLLAAADTMTILDAEPPPSKVTSRWRAERYRALAFALVERADLLVAIWRGTPARAPGGTAEVVEAAIAERTPVLHLDPATRSAKLVGAWVKPHTGAKDAVARAIVHYIRDQPRI